jgi:hypothetical protein
MTAFAAYETQGAEAVMVRAPPNSAVRGCGGEGPLRVINRLKAAIGMIHFSPIFTNGSGGFALGICGGEGALS